MAKLSVTRLLETSRMLATEAGKQLVELIEYVNSTSSEIIRSLRNGLTFQDNFDALVSTVEVKDDIDTAINTNQRTPSMIIIGRNQSGLKVDSFGWSVDTSGVVTIKVKFLPTATSVQRLTLLIIF